MLHLFQVLFSINIIYVFDTEKVESYCMNMLIVLNEFCTFPLLDDYLNHDIRYM